MNKSEALDFRERLGLNSLGLTGPNYDNCVTTTVKTALC
jgi:hypothetical protein